jgi:hypothetical protein
VLGLHLLYSDPAFAAIEADDSIRIRLPSKPPPLYVCPCVDQDAKMNKPVSSAALLSGAFRRAVTG